MPKDPRARLKVAAESMEAIWLTQMLREARPKGGMLDKSFAAQTFRDMLDQAMGDSMAKSGVVGLADTLVRQMLGPEQKVTLAQAQAEAAKIQPVVNAGASVPETKTNEVHSNVSETKGSEL
jgi:Rod binding domain-containing protein